MLLKYEDLVNNPIKYGQAVVEHFGAKMNNRLHRCFGMARSSSVGIHKHRSSEEINKAETIAKKELEIYGYL